MPRTAEQNEKIRQETRTNIVYSAMSLFAQSGYAHTTTRQIADLAGVSPGLMYHYFEGKEDLLQAVFDNCMVILNRVFTRAYEEAPPDQRLANLIQAMFDLLGYDRDFWALFYMMRSQPAVMALLGDDFRLWTARLRDLFIAELRAAGRVDPQSDALILYSLIEGTIQQYLLDPANYPLAAVARRIIAGLAS
jgi:AcrR family transcriptional regulator